MADFTRQDGLIYSEDNKKIVGIDGSGAFNGTIPYGAESIEDEVFSACPYEEITLPDSVKEIGVCLFENSTNLKTVKLPASLTELPPYLFSGCTALSKIYMPNAVSGFSEGLFKGCEALTDIPFRMGIQDIPESCMEGCKGIRSLVIPNTVTTIGKRACADCTNLTTVVLSAKLYNLAEDAFEGCDKISNIRVDGENHLFYVNEEDGCLYERSIEGDDILRLKVNRIENDEVGFFENEDDLKTDDLESFFTDEKLDEIDETCAPEVGVEENEVAEVTAEAQEETAMDENKTSEIDDLFADIMGDEKARNEAVSTSEVESSDEESAVLSEMMDVMSDKAPASSGAAISDEELANLFASNEENANKAENAAADPDALDGKTQILMDSAAFSKIIKNEPAGQVPEDPELYVIAEKTVTDENGNQAFSEKLEKCCSKIARIHDFTRVIILNGLPLDNEEFLQFYHHFINKKNVIVACEAASASKLSDYCKQVCEESRISLDKEQLAEQRRCISIKSDMLIKLIIQDI